MVSASIMGAPRHFSIGEHRLLKLYRGSSEKINILLLLTIKNVNFSKEQTNGNVLTYRIATIDL
jgi:hypothetical protein